MKARRALDRIYREKARDRLNARQLDAYLSRAGISRSSLCAYLKTERALRIASGRATKVDRMLRAWELRREAAQA